MTGNPGISLARRVPSVGPPAWPVILLISLVVGCAPSAVMSGPTSSAGGSPGAKPSTSTTATSTPRPTPTARPTKAPLALLPTMPTEALDGATSARLLQALKDFAVSSGPDAIAAVITADGTWAGAVGIDGPDGRAAEPTDEFGLASVSKMISAALILRLAEQGKLDLDAPLASYLTGMKVDANGGTVRQALAMRSGLGDTVSGAIDAALAACETAMTTEAVLATIPAPFGPPGDTYHYSNPTFKLLHFAAQTAAGKAYGDALKAEVLDPTGTGDRILLQGPDRSPPQPWALPIASHTGSLDPATFGTGGTLPCLGFSTLSLSASAMAGDAPSVARFGWELFAGKVLGLESLQAMTTVDESGHGLGIDRVNFGDDIGYGHTGSMPGYAALLAVIPQRQISVAFFINDEQGDVTSGARKLVAALEP